MKEVNSLFLFALDLNHVLHDNGNHDIAAHPSCPILKCKDCRVTLVCKCSNKKCKLFERFISEISVYGHEWPEFACSGCKRASKVLSLIPNCQQGCFDGVETKVDREEFEMIQKKHMQLFSEIEPVLNFASVTCMNFGYDRVVSVLAMENIENICKTVFSFWFVSGVTFKACIGFFGFAKDLILHMHELRHPLVTVAIDVLSSFMRTNVEQFIVDQNEWNQVIKAFHKTKNNMANEMTRRLGDVDRELDSCLALKCLKSKAFNIAVVGESGSGKSSLINALRGVRPGMEGSARVGVSEMTMKRSHYDIPYNEHMVIFDLPGIGSVNMTEKMYLSIVEFAVYDFFILVSSCRITGRDIWFAQQIRKHGKAAFFVKTKIDIDIENEECDHGKSATETMSKLRNECEMEMKNIGLYDMEIFLMSRVKKRLALMQTKRQEKTKRQDLYIKVAESLKAVETSLDNESRNVKVLKVSTASVSLVCGVASSACLIAAPFTLGVSLIPGIVLGAVAAASGFTTAGSSVVEKIRQKKKIVKMKAAIEELESPCADSDDATLKNIDSSKVGVSDVLQGLKGAGTVTGSTIGITLRGLESGAVSTLSSFAKVVRVGGGIIGLVAVPFDVYTIVTESIDLHKGNYSAVAQDIREKRKVIERKLYCSAYKRRCPNSHGCAYIY
ncbi:IIGP1-like protein [Mya arenaria]|uniref:IIGP1-like protein n=1 Tax=Mya arenaria TaxID=6604 RepID=A0ABY7G4P4_MYAAR|nr:IIGP1-like protein [Mya arenaria]